MARMIFAFLAIVAVAAVKDLRPTNEEFKASKAEEADDKAAAAAVQAKKAAVDKVVTLLESLQTQVMAEGEKEAASYNKFACFCKDTTSEKQAAIQQGEDDSTALTATINELSSTRDSLDTHIEETITKIKDAEKEMKEAMEAHQKALKEYATNEADLSGALQALGGAIKVLKASKAPALVQMQSIAETVRRAVLLADALGVATTSAQGVASMLLQQDPEVQMENYKFHSGDIVATLEQLLKDFNTEKQTVDSEEVKRVAEHDAFMQLKTDFVKEKNVELEQAKKNRANTIAEIAANSQELSTVAATLLDDKEYMSELAQMCSDKAKTWDQRVKVRQDELSALTAAIGIVKGAVSENTSAASVRLSQQGVSVRLAYAVTKDADAMEAIEAEAESSEGGAPSFLQRLSVKMNNPETANDAIATLLRSKGKQLQSTLLTSLASQVEGPHTFDKIKALIQDLIDRLLSETANESNQKGWCDKATADAEQKREYAAEEIGDLNGQMAGLEARRDKLTEELEVLTAEIKELNEKRDEANSMFGDETAENEATVAEAEAGKEAVESAIDILDKFYKTAAKESVGLSLAQGPADDAPDAGFDNGEAYTGAGGEAGGIIGMLDVIKSDFARTISETQKSQAQAEQDHLAFMTESGKSLAVKTSASEEKTRQNDDTKEELSKAEESLKSESQILVTSIRELLELKPVCVDTGMSYDERVARREDEIQALNKALCILKAYAQFGPEGVGGC